MRLHKILAGVLAVVMMCGVFTIPAGADETDKLLAFPGAEGGGKYTTGARGNSKIEVYHVTSLEDDKDKKGTLRNAVRSNGRIIVFDVGGIINLKSQLKIEKSNLTILGQTAPGDGITLTGNDVVLNNSDNLIIRYLRVRPTDSQGGEPDGLGGRWVKNVILDHCSVTWGVDELLTLYAGSLEEQLKNPETKPSTNITVQNCISAESLRMSNHFKGAHGYGGIIGASNGTYHHNLFAHHDSRNPRIDRNINKTDMVNNVIYNWGNNSTYGAEPYSYNSRPEFSKAEYASKVNIRNNYYKYGPSTKVSIRSKIFEATNNGTTKDTDTGEILKSDLYINGNFVYGNDAATQENTASENYVKNRSLINLLSRPIDMGEYEIPEQTAEEAFDEVTANAGATLPRRDSIDARIIADVKNGTGRIINSIEEVGGFSGITESKRTFEIPSDWKATNKMGSAKETDIVAEGKWKGYTWIEAYVNDWTEQQSAPSNPDISVISPAVADLTKTYDQTKTTGFWKVAKEGENVTYTAEAAAKTGTAVLKIELYDGSKLLETVSAPKIDTEVTLEAGIHYLTSKAYNNKGESTTSPTAVVYVTKDDNSIGSSTIDEIGTTSFQGKNNVWTKNGITYIGGSGLINGKSDSFSYWKHSVTGDFEFSAKIESVPKYENGVYCGIMFRESLAPDSRMVMISDGWRKYGENIMVPSRVETGADIKVGWLKNSSGKDVANDTSYDTYDTSKNLALPEYMKIARTGDTLTLSVSNDGINWTNNIRQPLKIDISGWSKNAYIGLAVDSVNGAGVEATPLLPWYSIGAFSDIKMIGVTPYTVTFDTDGGTIQSGNFSSYSYGDAKALPANVTKTDYYFGGWYDNKEFKGTALTAMPVTAAGNLTYYAKWNDTKPDPTPAQTALPPTPAPTSTPAPTQTPNPTNTPDPTNTPIPTNAPDPTNTPIPTNTPVPTQTPVPTDITQPVPTPTATQQPAPEHTVTPQPIPDIFSIEYSDGSAIVTSSKTGIYTVIFAVYDSAGALISVEFKPVIFNEAGENTVVPDAFDTREADSVKVMLWNNMGDMKPLCVSKMMK